MREVDESDRSGSCLDRIRQIRGRLTGARARVAATILGDPWAVRGVSMQVLAQRSGVSENAVSRLTHVLGYSGYREFAQALSLDLGKSLGFQHSHPVELGFESGHIAEGTSHLVERVMALEVECMQDTLAHLSEPQLRRAVAQLASASAVVLIGTGTAAPLCHMLAYRLASIGVGVSWTADPMMMLAQVSRLQPGDIVLGISYSGRSRDTVQTLQYAAARGVGTIGLTADARSPICTSVETILTIFSPSVSSSNAQFSARVAGLALLEAIATATAEVKGATVFGALEDLGANQARLNDLPDDALPQHRPDSGPLPFGELKEKGHS